MISSGLVFAVLTTALSAQQSVAARSERVTVENDLIGIRGAGAPPDYDYTHGTRIGVAWADAPAWLRRLARSSITLHRY